MQDNKCLVIEVSISIQYHYISFHVKLIELHSNGLQYTTNASIRRQTADHHMEDSELTINKELQCVPCDTR